MDRQEKAIVFYEINKEISSAITGLTSKQEPDYIAALVTKFCSNLPAILNSNIHGMKFKVGGCFIHQKPLAKFLNPPYLGMKSPELGDLLIVFKRIQNGEEQFNALLLQAKKNNTPFAKKIIPIDHQLVLYTQWPYFEYKRAGYLNGTRRSVQPKSCTPGAQYLLIDEQNSNHNHCYCHYPCPFCCNSPVMFYTAPSSSVIQASHCLAWSLVDFLEFHTGKPFVPKKSVRIDHWSQMIWDLLDLSAQSIFNRNKAGYKAAPRSSGDVIQMILSDNNLNINLSDKSQNTNDNIGISVIVIEGIDSENNTNQ